MKRRHYYWILATKFILSGALVWMVLHRVPLVGVLENLKQADRWWIALACVLTAGSVLLSASRWWLLAAGLIRWRQALKYTMIGLFYGSVLPGGVSGDVAKGAALALKSPSTRAVGLPVSIVMDRLIGFAALGVVFNLSCLALASGMISALPASLHSFSIIAFLTSALALGAFGLAVSPRGLAWFDLRLKNFPPSRLQTLLDRVAAPLRAYGGQPIILAWAFLIGLGIHLINVAAYVVLAHALGVSLDMIGATSLYAITSVIVMVPISISGLGLRDWFTVLFFEALGLSADTGVAFAWLGLAVNLMIGLVGGIVQITEVFGPREQPYDQTNR